jgi:hypothetical protein
MPSEDKSQDVFFNGYSFRRVKLGLDEKEVFPFIQTLIDERNELARRQENTPKLTHFIEKLTKEADEWAEQTKKEAREQALADSRAILSKAEEKAAQYTEEKKIEAHEQAAAEAKVLISSAQEQANKYLEERRKETIAVSQKEAEFIKHQAQIQVEAWVKEIKENLIIQLRGAGALLNKEMRTQSEDLKRRAAAFDYDFEKQLTDLRKREITIYTDSSTVNQAPTGSAVNQTQPVFENAGAAGQKSLAEPQKAAAAMPTAYTILMEETPKETKWVEIQIASGETDEITALKVRLEQQSEIGAAQITKDIDKTVISIFLRKPTDFIQKLMSFPEVKQAQEIMENEQIKYKVVLAKVPAKENMRDNVREQLRDWNKQH